jgi:hypothetical protein
MKTLQLKKIEKHVFFSYTSLTISTTLFSSANYIPENDDTFQG